MDTALVENFDVELLTQISLLSLLLERGRRKPPFNVFKWWGRRYIALSRAILSALVVRSKESIIKALQGQYDDVRRATQGKLVYDPFCGGGTIPIEASVMGFDAVCVDINPAAVYTANATYNLCSEDCISTYEYLVKALEKTFNETKYYWCFDKWCFLHVFAARCTPICRIPVWLSTKLKNGKRHLLLINEEGSIISIPAENATNIKPTQPFIEIDPRERNLPQIAKDTFAYAAELYTLNHDRGKVERIFVSFLQKEPFSQQVAEKLHGMILKARNDLQTMKLDHTTIPKLRETKRLYNDGITIFEELFTPRQLISFIKFLRNAFKRTVEASLIIANVMRTCSLLAIYYQPYAKMNPALVIKSFWLPKNPTELNPLAFRKDRRGIASIGRGTIASHLRELLRVCNEHIRVSGRVNFEHGDALALQPPPNTYAIVTDPPYMGKQSYRDVTLLHLYALKISGLIPSLTLPNDVNNLIPSTYVQFMSKFAKVASSVQNGAYLILMMGLPSEEHISYLIQIIRSFIREGFGLRNLYWVLGEAPGVMGRSKTYGVLVLIFRKGFENNIENLYKWLENLNTYQSELHSKLVSRGLNRILKTLDLRYEFSLYKLILEKIIHELHTHF